MNKIRKETAERISEMLKKRYPKEHAMHDAAKWERILEKMGMRLTRRLLQREAVKNNDISMLIEIEQGGRSESQKLFMERLKACKTEDECGDTVIMEALNRAGYKSWESPEAQEKGRALVKINANLRPTFESRVLWYRMIWMWASLICDNGKSIEENWKFFFENWNRVCERTMQDMLY